MVHDTLRGGRGGGSVKSGLPHVLLAHFDSCEHSEVLSREVPQRIHVELHIWRLFAFNCSLSTACTDLYLTAHTVCWS